MRTSQPSLLAWSRLFFEPGTRIASPKVVKMTFGISASATQSSTRQIGIDHAHVAAFALGLEQALLRARHAHRVAEGGEDDVRDLGQRHAVVDASHRQHTDGAAGTVRSEEHTSEL